MTNRKKNKKKKLFNFKVNKKHIICCLIVLAVITATITIVFIKNSKLNPIEKYAVEILTDYKTKLKNPSSLQVFEIRYKESYNTNNELIYNFYIDCSGQNGFGGNTRSIVYYTIVKDGKMSYLGNDDKANRTISKYTSESDKTEITMAKLIQQEWQNLEELSKNNLNIKKIIKKVEWKYEKENNYYMY